MKCVFVGSLKEDSGYIVEVLQEKEYEIIQAGEYDQIEKTINPVLESQAEIAVYDLLPLNDDPLEINISRFAQCINHWRIFAHSSRKKNYLFPIS